MALISPSATNPTLTSSGFTTFHRIVPTDSVEGIEAADWLAKKAKKVFVIDDTTEYGKGAADVVRQELKTKGITSQNQSVPADHAGLRRRRAGGRLLGCDARCSTAATTPRPRCWPRPCSRPAYKGIAMGGNGVKSSVFVAELRCRR